MSVAGSMRNTQARKEHFRKKEILFLSTDVGRKQKLGGRRKRHCVQLKNSQHNHLGNNICSSQWARLVFQTRTVVHSTFHCAHVTGAFLPTPWEGTLGAYLPLGNDHVLLPASLTCYFSCCIPTVEE